MTRADITDEVARVTEMTRKDCDDVVKTVFECMEKALVDGNDLRVWGFGTLGTRLRRARISCNPSTGEMLSIPPRRVLFFRPAKVLKDKVLAATAILP